MKTPEWYASYVRQIPAMTAEQKLVFLEIADCMDSMKLHIDAFESVAPTPGAVEDVMRENLLQNTKIQLFESTYSQLSKSLCSKENATPEEILQASDQLKTRICQAERERDAAVDRLSNLRICADCMHCGTVFHKEPCLNCAFETNPIYRPNWQWRGPCFENTKEASNEHP